MTRKRRDEETTENIPVQGTETADEEVTIDLVEVLNRILDHWLLVAVCAVVGALIMGVYSFFIATPMYQSTAKLYVVNSKDSAINLSDLQIGNYLAQDYQEVFHNWHVQDRVLEELGLNYTYSQLNSMISVSNPEISAEVAVKIYPEEEALPQPKHTLCEPVQNSSCIREDIQVIGGITYVNDIMLVNKTYPLPSDYNPGGMTPETEEAFSELRKTASEEAGLYLFSHSDFRSYHTQVYLYDDYCNGYGKEEADRFSARPGYSEHQTGMVIDVNWPGDAFNDTPEAIWLEENCWRFGFIVRFPREKEQFTGYKYESWHIRYVGKDWADKIYHSGLCLEEYFQVTSEYP